MGQGDNARRVQVAHKGIGNAVPLQFHFNYITNMAYRRHTHS
ncbi:hypothetical protein [Kingella kingae]|nr:hypothetical protein [Kingella kingae]MDK4529648.1 hypothetical protein [Kingella kingae]MDK4581208.1 hypothetical protein [Kingella kingae]